VAWEPFAEIMADEKDNEHLRRNTHVSNLWKSTWKGFMQMLEQAPKSWRGPDARHYRDEKEWIIQSAGPIFTGLFVSTFCFVTFRVSASRWWAKVQKTYFARKPTQLPLKNIAKEQQSAASQQPWRSTLERQAEQRKQEISELSQLPIDFALSILLGCSSFFLLRDSKKFQRDFSTSPLLPGKSLIHVHVCPFVTSTFQEMQRDEKFRNNMTVTDNDDDETLAMFEAFVKNCQIRSTYIQNQTGKNRPDIVPYPGLASKPR
jgi:hypothetical protein